MLSVDDVRRLLRDAVSRAGTQTALAAEIGVTPSYIGQILKWGKKPGPKVCAYLGCEEMVVYFKINV